jgi:hypothetical protein
VCFSNNNKETAMKLTELFFIVVVLAALCLTAEAFIIYLKAETIKSKQETTYWQDAALTCPTWPAHEVNR